MSSSQIFNESTILPVVLSAGIFLATTALSQWLNQGRRKMRGMDDHNSLYDDDDDNEEEEEDYDEEEENEQAAYKELKRWYHCRRLHDRLSYENLSKAVDNFQKQALESDLRSESSLDGENSGPHSTRRTSTSSRRMTIPSSMEPSNNDNNNSLTDLRAHPNSEYDFHPKNRNWRHFEHFNEEDKKAQLVASKNMHSFSYEMDQQFLTEDDDTDDDDAKSISSEGSASSEEQFVWTMHQHRHNAEEKRWSEVIQNKLSNGLTSLFDTSPIPGPIQEGQVASVIEPLPPPQQQQQQQQASNHHPQKPARSRMRTSSSLSDDKTDPMQHSTNPTKRTAAPRRSDSTPNLIATANPKTLIQRFLSFHSEDDQASPPPPPVANVVESPPPPVISHRTVRAQYNARIMPEKLIMIRHGQSVGNIDELLYSTIPDNAMPLTDLGWEQARMAGKVLKEKVLDSGETVHFIVSPYVRTVETFHGLVSAWCDPKSFSHIEDRDLRVKAWYSRLIEMGISWNEDSRIREQDFGNYQDPETIKKAKRERHAFGTFYYRFPHGESASDVFDRVSTFLDSLWRSFDMNRSRNYVLVTHGISIRVLLSRYFRYTIDQFNILSNPRNCEMVVLGHNGDGKLELDGRCQLEMEENKDEAAAQQMKVTGYKFHKRLRILPQSAIRKVKIRMTNDETD